MSLTTVTVAGKIEAPDSTPFDGKTFWFTSTAETVDAAGNILYPITRFAARVVDSHIAAADGESPLEVIASDAGAVNVPYEIQETWRNGRTFTVNLLTTMVVGGVIPYSALGPVSPPPVAGSPYALLADVDQEIADRAAGDVATLGTAETFATTAVAGEATARGTAVTAEATARAAADTTLTTAVAGKAPALTTNQTQSQLPGIYVPKAWGTRSWRAALAANIANPAAGQPRLAVVGDSISQGYLCSDPSITSYAALLKTALQTLGGNGGCGYWPATYSDFAVNALAGATLKTAYLAKHCLWVTAGTWSSNPAAGIGEYALTTTVAGSTITAPTAAFFHGRFLDVYTIEGTVAATWTYSIDGGGAVTVTPGAANIEVKHTIDMGTDAVHAVVITFTGTGTFFFNGARPRNSAGVIVDNYSKYGATSANYNLGDTYGAGWNGGAKQPADALIWAFGANDANGAVTGDVWEQNLRKYLNDTTNGVLDGTGQTGATDLIILMNHIGKNDNAAPVYQDYVARARGLAEAYGAALVDLWAVGRNSWNYWNSLGYWGASSGSGAAGTDNIHLSDAGQAFISSTLAGILSAVA